jgi:hypothetical protein
MYEVLFIKDFLLYNLEVFELTSYLARRVSIYI